MDTQLEEMRQQLTTLKSKLNKQEIVNDRLVRRSMRNEVSNITRRYYILMALAVLMVPYGYWSFVVLSHLSIAFWIGTSVFMLVCAIATFYNSRKISDPGLMSHSLVEARRKVASAKKFDADWLLFGIPAVILWLGWFFYEVYLQNNGTLVNGLFWGGCFGGVIGATIGFKIHFKTQRQYQEIIDQIEDLTADEA
jgi:type VI protein secretion system component VasF